DQLRREDVVAQKGRALVVLAHQHARIAQRRPREPPRRPQRQQNDRERQPVEVRRAGHADHGAARQRDVRHRDRQAVVAARDVPPLEGDGVEELAERQRQQREVRAAQAHAERADEQSGQRARQRAQGHGHHERHTGHVLEHEADRVAADAEARRVAERQQSRVAEQQVERDGEQPEVEDLDHHPQPDGIEHPRHRVERGHRQRAQPRRSTHPFSPSSPCGRRISTTAIRRNWNTSANCGNHSTPNDCSSPTISAASNAPSSEPNPPITMTTKASVRMAAPIDGSACRKGAAITPASAASAEPTLKTPSETSGVLMPSALTISASETAERITMPTRVRRSTSPITAQITTDTARMNSRYTGYWPPMNGTDPLSPDGTGICSG